MEEYYRRCAEEYEEIYQRSDPVWRQELNKIADALRQVFKGRRVLEIACGTGYWTQLLSETAQSIVAPDILQEMLEIAEKNNTSALFHSAGKTHTIYLLETAYLMVD